jgi:phage anti-repressor protein
MNGIMSISNTSFAGVTIHTVNARELHAFLEVRKDFSNWIKDKIQAFGFEEGVDFITTDGLSSPKSASSKARLQKTIEYHITLSMGKELAMVERNAKGKQARLYFIECEKRALAPVQIAAPTVDPLKALELFIAVAKGQEAKLSALTTATETVSTATIAVAERTTALELSLTLGSEQQFQVKELVNAKVTNLAKHHKGENVRSLYSRVYGVLNRKFRVPRYSAIPKVKFEQAVKFINSISMATLRGG